MKLTVNALAMPPGRYGAWHIDRWSVTVASSEAPKRRHQGQCSRRIGPADAMVVVVVVEEQKHDTSNL
jgi:hypothetical protein